ncbi:hypothetical protein ABLE68_12765 [Nocardioides sp. CN2-186]|uniref:hypothetical protein n=1 Tax=Nocardioides tweenelious TaxID=3156607 RepID=UPI0032B49E37
MHALTALPQVATFVVSLVDDVPDDNDVKAGWVAFAIFIGLILAVAFLGFSLVKQLRKVDAAEEAGLYDPSDKKPVPQLPVDGPTDPR